MVNSNKSVMNVLYVSSIGEMGGVQRFLDAVISNHNPQIVKPIVLAFQDGHWLDELKERGISTYCIHDARIRQPVRVFKEVSRILQKENIHIVHSALP